jgi:NAD(P)-dependent dehydrogenase (short-subunit alcohol dehydrogenase family)
MTLSTIFSLENRTILVTGASSGIGRSIAQMCSQMGAKVILHGRDLDRLTETRDRLCGHGHEMHLADFQKHEEVIGLADKCSNLNGVVHSAGIDGVAPMRMVQQKMLQQVFQVNYMSPVLLTQRLLQKKKLLNSSSILFLSSIAANTGKVGVGPYSGSKAALLGTMRPLALEVAKREIRVNALCPGIVRTPIFSGQEDWLNDEVVSSYPLGLGEPEDIAHAAVFFMSDASRKITGIDFSIDGGVPFT